MPVGLVSRNGEKLERLVEDLEREGITADSAPADIRDASALASAVGALADRLGAIDVLEYSPVPAGDYMEPDHDPDEVADVLWRHHAERGDLQIRVGIN